MIAEEPILKTQGLSKNYGEICALSDFSIEVKAGEIVSLVGPNGAGKTTALKMMVGMLSPSAGRAWIGGFDVFTQPLQAKHLLSFVPDKPFLYEQLSVSEFLAFLGGVYSMNRESLEKQADVLLELFDLKKMVHARIGELSYGMQSRIALLASFIHGPKVLLLDEPFFGLDPQTLRIVKKFFIEKAAQGMAVVLSTHQLSIVEDIASRVFILSRGNVAASGSIEELRRTYGAEKLEDLFFRITDTKDA